MKTAHVDFECRSGADVTDVGAYRHAIDPRFEILLAAVSWDDSDEVFLWVNPLVRFPGMLHNSDEAEAILAEADLFEAFNAPYEIACCWGAFNQGKACPFKTQPRLEQWLDTAAVARKAGMPGSLDGLCDALQVKDPKDRRGKTLIKLFCQPDEDTGDFVSPLFKLEEFKSFGDYNCQDVRAEKACGRKLKPFALAGAALETYQFDLRMNQRGVPINRQAAENAQKIINETQSGVTEKFRRLTGLNPTQREKVRVLLGMQNMQATTVEVEIARLESVCQEDSIMGAVDPEDEKALCLLNLYQKVSYSAVKKIKVMLDCICPDDRVRGLHMYYGAGTGRWSSKILQVQNLKKSPAWMKDITDEVYLRIAEGRDPKFLDQVYGEPLELISGCIRHFIHHSLAILNGDFNAIEGRISCWRSGETEILACWARGEDLYKRAAAFVEGCREEDIKNPSPERDFGKVVELACQFGLGTNGFMRTCANWGIECDEKKAQKSVHGYYRPTHPNIVKRWYFLDNQMREAINHPRIAFEPFIVRTISGIPYMLLKLPSGRSLSYPYPEINPRDPTEEELEAMEEGKKYHPKRFLQVSYWGQFPTSGQWGRIRLHGSKAHENEVQGIATDFMAHGAITAEKRGMKPFMLVHDQGLALRTNGQTPEDYAAALGDLPPWAKGFPMKVDVKIQPYFRKA